MNPEPRKQQRRLPRGIGVILAALVVCLTAREASATQIDFTGLGKAAAVNVTLNSYTYDGVGGELGWAWIGGTPSGYSSSFYAYCVDLLHYLTDPQTVTLRSTDVLNSSNPIATAAGPYVADAGAKAAWLFNTYAPVIRASGTATQAAALQVAIWEALYDTTSNLSGGAFKLNNQSTNAAVASQAVTYLAALYSGPGGSYKKSVATWLDAPLGAGQDQITAMPTPEPASLLLLGTGMAYLVRRRRRGVTRS